MIKLETLKQMFFDLDKSEKLEFESWVKNQVSKILIYHHEEDKGLWNK